MKRFYNFIHSILFFLIVLPSVAQTPSHLNCVKLNHLYRKACHNCFEYDPLTPLTFYQCIDYTKVLELDLHSHKSNGTESAIGVWNVRHLQFGTSNNDNNCGSGDENFNICLEDVQQWSIAHPNHEPIIIYLDLKRKNISGGPFWENNHQPEDLDNVLYQFAIDMGGIDVVYKPSDLQGGFAELRFAAFNENWPSLGNLKNKFMFVLTGDNNILDDYLNHVGDNAMAFVAASVSGNPVNINELNYPSGISSQNWKYIVNYNLEQNQIDDAKNFIPSRGFMSRSWQSSHTTPSRYGDNIYNNVNNIAIINFLDNNLNSNMNFQLIGINNILVSGSQSFPKYIDSYYDNILQHALQKVTTQNLIVNPNTHYNLRAGQEVNLLPGTHIKSGAKTHISIGNCSSYSSNLRLGNDSSSTNYTKNITEINEDTKQPIAFLTYPNPTYDVVNVSYKFDDINEAIFILYDLTGRFIRAVKHNPVSLGIQNFKLDVSDLKKGTYFYTLQVGTQSYNGKIIKLTH